MVPEASRRRRSIVATLFAAIVLVVSQFARAADVERGQSLYTARCGACHSITDNGAGPRHAQLFGRKAGTQPGFDYSPALRAAALHWNARTLDRWISNPSALVPGNKMVVQLANDPRDRADIIAYLQTATSPMPPAHEETPH